MAPEPGRRRVVEHHRVRRRVFTRERPVHPVPQLHHRQRVHPQIEEPHVGRGERPEPEQGTHLVPDEVHEERFALRPHRLPQPAHQPAPVGGGRLRPATGGEIRDQRRRRPRPDRRPVHRGDRGVRRTLAQQPRESPEPLFRRHPREPRRRQPAPDPFALFLGFAETGPRPPLDGLPGKAPRPPVERQPVEERVRRRVIRLPGAAEQPRETREQHEEAELQPERRPVEMPSAQHLRPEHPLKARPVLVRQRGVRQRSHAVDHPAERRQSGFGANPGHQPFHRRGVRHVSDLDPHLRAGRPQPGDLVRRRRVRRAAAVQHHRASAGVEQPPGDREADAAQPAGHQHAAVPAHPSPVRGLSPPRRRRRPRRPDEAGRPPRLAPMRDLDLPVRPEELRRQFCRRRRPLRVQVQKPHRNLREFARHGASEPPEQRPGEGPAALVPERLTAAGHEPQPGARRHSRVLEPLRQRQGAARHPLHVVPERRRGRVRSRIRHPAEVRDPPEFAGRKSLEELAPPVAAGTLRLRRHDHPLPVRLQFPDQFLPKRRLAGPHHPETGIRRRLRRAAGQQHPRGLRNGSRFSLAHDHRFPEPRLRQRPPPSGRTEQRVRFPVAIRKPPPAGQQAEGQIQPAAGLHHLERQQQSRRREQPAAVRERLPEVARRVQHVRRHHQIEAVRLEPLFARVALDVQHPEVQTRLTAAEPFRRRRQEARRHVGEHVVRPPAGQPG